MGGVVNAQRFSSMFNSYTLTEHARWSPGLILISHLMRACADRRIASYDLGAGYATYKRWFCKTTDPLFEAQGHGLQQLLLGAKAVVEGTKRRMRLGGYRPGRGRGHPVPGHDRERGVDQFLASSPCGDSRHHYLPSVAGRLPPYQRLSQTFDSDI